MRIFFVLAAVVVVVDSATAQPAAAIAVGGGVSHRMGVGSDECDACTPLVEELGGEVAVFATDSLAVLAGVGLGSFGIDVSADDTGLDLDSSQLGTLLGRYGHVDCTHGHITHGRITNAQITNAQVTHARPVFCYPGLAHGNLISVTVLTVSSGLRVLRAAGPGAVLRGGRGWRQPFVQHARGVGASRVPFGHGAPYQARCRCGHRRERPGGGAGIRWLGHRPAGWRDSPQRRRRRGARLRRRAAVGARAATWPHLPTGVRLGLALPLAVAFARPDFLGAGVVAVLLALALATDYADGIVARRRGTASAAGQLFDHATDCLFVTAGLTGAALAGAVPLALPVLVVVAFGQYVFDSYLVHRQKRLRMSTIGRWNGTRLLRPARGDRGGEAGGRAGPDGRVDAGHALDRVCADRLDRRLHRRPREPPPASCAEDRWRLRRHGGGRRAPGSPDGTVGQTSTP